MMPLIIEEETLSENTLLLGSLMVAEVQEVTCDSIQGQAKERLEGAQTLRAMCALVEGLGLILSIHLVAHNCQ